MKHPCMCVDVFRNLLRSAGCILLYASMLPASADVSFVTVGGSSFSACPDYFTSQWSEPLDMNESSDVLYNIVPLESSELGPYHFLNGIFSTTPTGGDPRMSLLTDGDCSSIKDSVTRYGDNKPIDTTYYRQLTFRMYAARAHAYRVHWTKAQCPDKPWAITFPHTVDAGWKTYTVNLDNDQISAYGGTNYGWSQSPVSGLRFNSLNSAGAEVRFDWIQLTPPESQCPNVTLNFTLTNGSSAVLYLDDPGNSNPADGYYEKSDTIVGNGAQKTVTFSTARLFPGIYSVYAVEASGRTTVLSGGIVVNERRTAKFRQPDEEGGADFFVKVKGRPANMSALADLESVNGLSSAAMHPGEVYTDSGGAVRTGDFFQGTQLAGHGDSQAALLYYNKSQRIDPEVYKVACFNLDVLMPVTSYHSMMRLIWRQNSAFHESDDILARTTGDHRYCFRMDSIALDKPEATHPWVKNSDGSGLDVFRIDPMEEMTAETFRLDEVRLAADHEADTAFAVAIDADLDVPVTINYATSPGGAGLEAGTLAVGRSSNVLLWNTSALPAGRYYLSATIGSDTFWAKGPVVVRHPASFPDTAGPVLNIDAPRGGYVFDSSLEIAGYAVDETRVAVIEVKVDGSLVASIVPSDFRKEARDAYPTWPYNSTAGFQRFIDLSSLRQSSHQVAIRAFDTAGNYTDYSAAVDRLPGSGTPPVSYQPPAETPIAFPVTPTATPVVPGKDLHFSIAQNKNVISYKVSKIDSACSTFRIFASSQSSLDAARSAGPVFIFNGPPNKTVLEGKSTLTELPKKLTACLRAPCPVKIKPGDTWLYADCGPGSQGRKKKIDYNRIWFSAKPKQRLALSAWWKKQLGGKFRRTK